MCFTVAVNVVREEMERRFGASFTDPSWFKAGYLFSAFRLPVLPVITADDPGVIRPAKWGLIPGWVKNTKDAQKIRYKTFNARAETIFEKPSFRKAAKSGHCLVPVTGFYEWHDATAGKIPYFIYLKEDIVFALAGLYEEWTDRETGVTEPTFSIITIPANPLLEKIHNRKKRMPAVLSAESEKRWLDANSSVEVAGKILKPPGVEELGFYPVSKKAALKDADPYDPAAVEPFDYGYDILRSGLYDKKNE